MWVVAHLWDGLARILPESSTYEGDHIRNIDETVCVHGHEGFTYGQVSKVVGTYTSTPTGSAKVDQIIKLALRTSCPSVAKELGVTMQ